MVLLEGSVCAEGGREQPGCGALTPMLPAAALAEGTVLVLC